MYRKWMILIILLITGCSKSKEIGVNTVIEKHPGYVISINYPVTGYDSLDTSISNYIDSIYNSFNEKVSKDIYLSIQNELNIDYSYLYEVSGITVTLNIMIDDVCYDKVFKYSTDYVNNTKLSNIGYYDSIDSDKVFRIINSDSKVIAITFDDGPSKYTDDIIDILKDNNSVATFFILGNKVSIYKDVLIEGLKNGNELGNHTYNHKWLTRLNDDEIKKQIFDTQSIIFKELGYSPKLFRPSYGDINKRVRNDINLDVVLWNIDTMDWKYKSVNKIVSRALSNVSNGKIILMHETYSRSVEALKIIIPKLKDLGYELVTVSELKEIQKLRKSDA